MRIDKLRANTKKVDFSLIVHSVRVYKTETSWYRNITCGLNVWVPRYHLWKRIHLDEHLTSFKVKKPVVWKDWRTFFLRCWAVSTAPSALRHFTKSTHGLTSILRVKDIARTQGSHVSTMSHDVYLYHLSLRSRYFRASFVGINSRVLRFVWELSRTFCRATVIILAVCFVVVDVVS